MKNKKIKTLWVSDSPEMLQVGQARVTRELCYRLHDLGCDIEVAGYNPDAKVFTTNPIDEFTVHNIQRFDADGLLDVIEKTQPDVIVCSHDFFMFDCIKAIRKKFGSDHKIIGYFTIDGEPVPHIFSEIFYLCDHVVLPSEYGRKVVAESFFDIPLSVIPYAVNNALYNATEREKTKKSFTNSININLETMDIENKKVYLYVGNNQGRKNVGVARDAFKRLADSHPGEALFICIMKSGVLTHGDVRYIGYFDPLYFTHPDIRTVFTQVSDDIIAKFYRVADFLLHPSNGEGFGLTLLEAMASNCIPITTNYSASTDFCNDDNSVMIKKWTKMIGEFEVIRALVNEDDLVKVLEKTLKMSKRTIKKKQLACQQMAKNYSWDASALKFKELIEALVTDVACKQEVRVHRM